MLRSKAGVRVGLEVGIDQVRDLPRMPVQLDQVRPLDLAKIRPGAALVHPEQPLEAHRDQSDDGVHGNLLERLCSGSLAGPGAGCSIVPTPRSEALILGAWQQWIKKLIGLRKCTGSSVTRGNMVRRHISPCSCSSYWISLRQGN